MTANAIASVDVVTRVGIEATENTAVPCTIELPTLTITPQSQITSEQFTPQGSKHPGSSVIHKRFAQGPYEGVGDFNALPYVLHSLVGKDAASPSTPAGATNARQYDFTPKSRGADSRSKTFTTERGPLGVFGRTQRMTGTRFISFRLEAAQESIKVSGNLMARYPTTGNYLTGNEVQTVTITGIPTGGTFTLTFLTNEVQSILVDATGGTFTLTYAGQTTTALAFNASAATIQAALEALSNIAVGDVSVTGGPVNTAAVLVEFKGALGSQNVAQMTSDPALLTGGAGTATVTTTVAGSQTTAGIAYNATAATVQAALEALASIAVGDVSVTGGPGPGTAYVVEFTGTLGETNVAQMTASGGSLTGGTAPDVTVATTQAGAAITIVDQREISREMVDIYLDDDFDDLGETKLTGVYTYTLEVGEKFTAFWVFNTDNASYDQTVEQAHSVNLTLRTAHNAQSEAQFDSIGDNLHKFVRFEGIGAEIDEGVNNELARFDFAGKITQATPLYNDGAVYAYEYAVTGVRSSAFGGNVWSARSIVDGALPGLS